MSHASVPEILHLAVVQPRAGCDRECFGENSTFFNVNCPTPDRANPVQNPGEGSQVHDGELTLLGLFKDSSHRGAQDISPKKH